MDLARSVATALAAALVLGGCGPLPSERSADPAPGDAAILREVERAWRYVTDRAGGYQSGDFSAPSSLYATSWNLRLAAVYGIPIPNLSPSDATAWLEGAADSEPAATEIASRLLRWNLAAHALNALGHRPDKERVRKVLSEHQRGHLFAPGVREAATWASTLWAVELMSLSDLDVPQPTVDALRSELPKLTASATDADVLNQLLPAWTLAARLIRDPERASLRESLRTALLRVHTRATGTPAPDAVSLGVLYQVYGIAVANGIDLPPMPRELFGSLQSPNGYLAFAPGLPGFEPQATYHAARLGMPQPERLADLIKSGAGRTGWRNTIADVNAATTFHSYVVAKALGQDRRLSPLRSLAEMWFERLKSPRDLDLARDGREHFFAVALGQALGVAVDAEYKDALRERIDSESKSVRAPGMRGLAWLIRIANLLGLPATPTVRARLTRAVVDATSSGEIQRMDAAYYASLVADHVGAAAAQHSVRQFVEPLRSDDGTFRESSAANWSDLQATCAGIELSKSPAPGAVGIFMTETGTVMQPVHSPASRWHSAESVFFGLVIAGRIADPHQLCYQ